MNHEWTAGERAIDMRRTYRHIAGLALLSLSTAACGNSFGPELFDYARALDRWEDAGFDDYSFDYRLSCFCGPPAGRLVRVDVASDSVASARFLDDDEPVPPVQRETLPTIDDLFERIARTLEREPHRFEAEYDPQFGYPSFVSVDVAENIADDEFAFEVRLQVPFSGLQIGRN